MKRILTLAALFAAGCAAALTLGATHASAWDWTGLPAGYSVSGSSDGACPDGSGATRHWITVNGTQIFPSTCDAGFQAALDAYVDSTICTVNPAAGGSACAPATTALPPATTTLLITTATPSTTPASPTDTTANSPGVTTVADSTSTVVTVVTTLTPVEQALSAQLAALAAQIAALTDRVTVLEKAGDAAWLAFQQSIAKGDDAATAAAIARGTYLNAVYGLGDFAP